MDKIRKFLLESRKGAAKAAKAALPVIAPKEQLPAVYAARKSSMDHNLEERALRDEKLQYIQLCMVEKSRGRTWQDAALAVAARDAALMPRLAAKNLLNYNNLRNWVDGRPGKPGLRNPATREIDFSRRDYLLRNYGRDEERQGDGAFWTAVIACYLNAQHLKLSKIYRKIAKSWQQRYPERVIPSLAAIRYYIRQKYPRRMLALARDGEVAFHQKFRDYLERDPETIRPNECWVADTRMLDFMIRVERDGKWVAVRPWVCTILDVKSEFVVSCQLGVESVTNAVIRNALGDAISKYGRPAVFLIDNGADYCAKGFTTPVVFTPSVDGGEAYTHSIAKELDIEVRKALPYNAQTKVIERFFKEMSECDAFHRGYVGNCPDYRPATAEVWAKPENCNRLYSEWQAAEKIYEFIRDYHDKPNHGKYCKGLTPAQAFAYELRLNRPQMTEEEYFFAFLKPLATSRKVDPRGPSVSCGKARFIAVDRRALWPYDNKQIMVKFDNVNANRCFAFTLEGKFLTECRKADYVAYFARTDAEVAKVTAAIRRREGERKELQTLIMDETKGFHKLDPATIYLLDAETLETGTRLQLIDRRTSVRGETHNPSIYAAPGEVAPQLPPPAAPRQAPRTPGLELDVESVLLGRAPGKSKHPALPDEPTVSQTPTRGEKINENFI